MFAVGFQKFFHRDIGNFASFGMRYECLMGVIFTRLRKNWKRPLNPFYTPNRACWTPRGSFHRQQMTLTALGDVPSLPRSFSTRQGAYDEGCDPPKGLSSAQSEGFATRRGE